MTDLRGFLGMASRMNRTPSLFDSKQSHNSPVMVTLKIWMFLGVMILARTFGNADFDFHNGNGFMKVKPSDLQYFMFAPPISIPQINELIFFKYCFVFVINS